MDNILRDIQALGITINKQVKPFDLPKLCKIVNTECSKFVADDKPESNSVYFYRYMFNRILASTNIDKVSEIFNGILVSCEAYYKTNRDMKVFFKLIERGSCGTKYYCTQYMKLRKFILEAMQKPNQSDQSLNDVLFPFDLAEKFAISIDLSPDLLKQCLTSAKVDLKSIKGSELALAMWEAIRQSKPQEGTIIEVASPAQVSPAKGDASPDKQGSPDKPASPDKRPEAFESYKKPSFISKVIEDNENNMDTLGHILFKLHSDTRFNSKITGNVDSRL
jgi:hypothetical protein